MFKNIDEEWLKQADNRYKLVKTSFENDKTVRKILAPKKYRAHLQNFIQCNYFLTSGNDKKIRYWDL